MLARELEQVQRAVDVCIAVKLWLRKRRTHTSTRRKMYDAVKTVCCECIFERSTIANVNFGDLITRVVEVPANVSS